MMGYIAWSLAGLFLGAVVTWLVATKRAQSEIITKVGDADRKTAAAESKTASAEAIAGEVRRQYEEVREKAESDFQELRAQLSSESEARVKAEAEKEDLAKRLEDEKRLLAEAREKLTDTFKALGRIKGVGSFLWNYCNVLRDDGMSHDDYPSPWLRTGSEQLTYLLS